MLTTVGALVPTVLLILSGLAVRRFGFVTEAFWPSLDRLLYFFFAPALLINSLARADLAAMEAPELIAALYAALTLQTILLLLSRRLVGTDGPAFTSVFQGALRFNTFVGLGVVDTIWGRPGLQIYAVIFGCAIPLINVYSVSVMLRFAGGGSGWGVLATSLAKNPLIWGCAIGFVLNLTHIGLPGPIAPTMKALADSALALGLITVGAGLSLSTITPAARWPVLAATIGKHLTLPVFAWGACLVLNVTGLPRLVLLAFAGMPTASNAYILARQMGGDAPLMATIIMVSTIVAAAGLPLLLWLAS